MIAVKHYGDPRQYLTTARYPFSPTVANNDIRAFKMYLDEFCIALSFIEKSFSGNGRNMRSYVILNEIFVELLLKKLPMEDRALSYAQCLDLLNRTRKFSPDRAARLVEDVVGAIGENNSKKLFDGKNESSKHEIMDQVKFEYKCYQVENLPNGF